METVKYTAANDKQISKPAVKCQMKEHGMFKLFYCNEALAKPRT
jgi:hypothetical protein